MSDPEKVLIAGDWHGNRRWAVDVIWKSRKLLESEEQRIIVQLGDFGFWPWKVKDWAPGDTLPDGLRYLMDVQAALTLADAYLMVTPGNHDDYDALERWQEFPGTFHPDTPQGRLDRIYVLPRGERWQWHGRTWLSAGGAVSVDRLLPRPGRVQGETWWAQEEITDEQEAAIIAGGHADVMVAHDYPGRVHHEFDHHFTGGVITDGGRRFYERPMFHEDDLARARAHQDRMQRIVDTVQPSHYLHGHLHRAYSRTYDWGWGPVEVTGLDMDGSPSNFAVLNVRTMEWE